MIQNLKNNFENVKLLGNGQFRWNIGEKIRLN